MISLNSMLGMLEMDLALGKPKQHRYLPHEAFSEPKAIKIMPILIGSYSDYLIGSNFILIYFFSFHLYCFVDLAIFFAFRLVLWTFDRVFACKIRLLH